MVMRSDLILDLNEECERLVELTKKVTDLYSKFKEIDDDFKEYQDDKCRNDRYRLLEMRIENTNKSINYTKENIQNLLIHLKCYDDTIISVDRL